MASRRRIFWVGCFSLLVGSTGVGQETDQIDLSKIDPAAMEEMMHEFATPVAEHELFKRMEGTWTTETKSFYPNPAEPSVSEGTSEFKLIMGGRYLMQNFRGTFDGKEFQGMGINAFDKAQKKYVGVWIDNMGTGLMHTEGAFDASTNTMTETASAESPMGTMQMKMVTKHLDDRTFSFTMYMKMPDGNEMKNMEIVYRRK